MFLIQNTFDIVEDVFTSLLKNLLFSSSIFLFLHSLLFVLTFLRFSATDMNFLPDDADRLLEFFNFSTFIIRFTSSSFLLMIVFST